MSMGKIRAETILALGLALSLVMLAAAILIGVINGSRELSELGVRALSVLAAAVAGALGYQMGKNRDKNE